MNDKILNRLLFLGGFLVLVFYFGLIHPLVPFDTDDWININVSRPLFPSLADWNPTKLFPERLEPSVSLFASLYVTPITGDYVSALVMSNAFVVSLFITFYLFSVQKLLTDRFRIGRLCSFCIVLLYALLHFLILKTKNTGNDYLFYSEDSNCYYHYIIPNMLCASLVIWLMMFETRRERSGWQFILPVAFLYLVLCFGHFFSSFAIFAYLGFALLYKIVRVRSFNLALLGTYIRQQAFYLTIVLVTYFALCSNLYSTIILIAYIGAILLYDLLAYPKGESNWLWHYIRLHAYHLTVLVLWLIIQWFEANGIRANAYGHISDPLADLLLASCKSFLAVRYNVWAFGLTLAVSVGAVVHYAITNTRHQVFPIGRLQVVLLIATLLSLSYLLLLCSRVRPENMMKGQVIFEWAFFILLLAVLCLGYLSARLKAVRCLLPLAILLTVFSIRNVRTEFLGVQCLWETTEAECIVTDRDIIDQVRYAEALGLDTLAVRVPKFEYEDNWPLAFDCGYAVGFTLYKQYVVPRHLRTTFTFDE